MITPIYALAIESMNEYSDESYGVGKGAYCKFKSNFQSDSLDIIKPGPGCFNDTGIDSLVGNLVDCGSCPYDYLNTKADLADYLLNAAKLPSSQKELYNDNFQDKCDEINNLTRTIETSLMVDAFRKNSSSIVNSTCYDVSKAYEGPPGSRLVVGRPQKRLCWLPNEKDITKQCSSGVITILVPERSKYLIFNGVNVCPESESLLRDEDNNIYFADNETYCQMPKNISSFQHERFDVINVSKMWINTMRYSSSSVSYCCAYPYVQKIFSGIQFDIGNCYQDNTPKPYPKSYSPPSSSKKSCIALNQSVTVNNGTTKLLKDIIIGDKVLTETGYSTYLGNMHDITHSDTVLIHTESGNTIELTKEHIVKTVKGFVREICLSLKGTIQIVLSVHPKDDL